MKCAQYWPEEVHGSITALSQFTITLSSFLPFAEQDQEVQSPLCKYKCKQCSLLTMLSVTNLINMRICPLSLSLSHFLLSLLPPLFTSISFPPFLSVTSSQASEPEKPSQTVTHLRYTAWPDHGVPQNTMYLISFICRVRKLHPLSLDQPLLVHCSAGVSRTGTFILLDAMMQQMRSEGSLSVYWFLRSMRGQRIMMVQTQVCQTPLHTQSMH